MRLNAQLGRPSFFRSVVISLFSFPMVVLAQSNPVGLQVTSEKGSFLATVTFTTTDKTCAVDLYGSTDTASLESLVAPATLVAKTGLIDGIATVPAEKLLPILKKKRGASTSVSFRARVTCSGAIRDSDIISITVKTSSKRGVSGTKGWLRQLSKLVPQNSFELVDATPDTNFDRPVDIQYPGDRTNRFFVVEQSGKIYQVKKGKPVTKTLLIDLSDRVKVGGNLGLLSMAFHPKFAKNGYFYVHYNAVGTGNTVVARYNLKNGSKTEGDPGSEKRIFQLEQQPEADHVGGQIAFGKDGFLYIAMGDGGSGAIPRDTSRKLDNLYGKILRLDVNTPGAGLEYSIPAGNPFGNEIWAYGLRNPFKMSFDRPTGRLWAADVGQDLIEEIDIIEGGKHYGWNTLEGSVCYSPPTGCDPTGTEPPVFEFTHTVGRSITGGYVYRGSTIQPLKGFYIYGDFLNGKLFGLRYGDGPTLATQIADTEDLFSTFGLDRENELYVAAYTTGKIYRFAKRRS